MRSYADPRHSFLDVDATARVKEIDPELQVVFDAKRQKLVVLDLAAPGGFDHEIVMIVQEPNGAYRPFDGRTLENLRRIRPERRDAVLAEVERGDAERQARHARATEAIADGMADDLKWLGKQWTPSVAWRDRSAAREAIREAAR